MRGGAFGVALVAGESEGGGEHREVVHARELPDLLDVSRDILGAVVDVEAVVDLRGSLSGHRIEEPVRVLHVPAHSTEELPPPRQHLLRPRSPFGGHRRERPAAALRLEMAGNVASRRSRQGSMAFRRAEGPGVGWTLRA